MPAMLRITVIVLALTLASGSAFAQLSIEDIKDEVSRLDTRHFNTYRRKVNNREFFAALHDSIGHGAYKAMKDARDTYVAIRSEISRAVAEEDAGKATKRIPDLMQAGETLDARVEKYTNSSADAVMKIQIGLGVVAFLVCGLGFWLFRRRRRR
jgi:hypothetical protein